MAFLVCNAINAWLELGSVDSIRIRPDGIASG